MKLNNPITQEPMESEIDFQIMMVLHNTNHKVNPYGDSTVSQLRTLFSKWLQQERAKTAGKVLSDVARFVDPKEFKKLCSKYIMHS